MVTLTRRNLDEGLIKHLRVRAAEHGRLAEAKHRELLRVTLAGNKRHSARDAKYAQDHAGKSATKSVADS